MTGEWIRDQARKGSELLGTLPPEIQEQLTHRATAKTPPLAHGSRVVSLVDDGVLVTKGLTGTVTKFFPNWTQGMYSGTPEVEWDNNTLSVVDPETLQVIPDARVITATVYRRDYATNWSKSGPNYPQERSA